MKPTSSLCRHYSDCGGCDLLHQTYNQTLKDKESRLKKIFSTYKGVYIAPILPSSPEHHYRHKVQLPFGRSNQGIVVGLLSRDRRKIISQKECYIQHPHLTLIAGIVENWARENNYTPYDERNHSGSLRHLLLRRSSYTGEILMAISLLNQLPGDAQQSYNQLANTIQKELKQFKLKGIHAPFAAESHLAGIIEILRRSKGNIVLDGKRRTVYGTPFIKDKIGKSDFTIAIESFFQTNPYQIEPLYQLVKQHIESASHIIDAYAGMGTIGLFISDQAKSVTCIEQNPQAVKAGKAAITKSGKKNIKIFQADAGIYLLHKLKLKYGLTGIVLDPPREGLTKEGIHGLLKAKSDTIIYVSCDPISLKRDIDVLQRFYFLKSLEPVDMFPFTNHLETVAFLTKK